MYRSDKINLNFPTVTAGAACVSLINPLVNNQVIIKKSAELRFAFMCPQSQLMNDFVGNPVKREIFFIMADDPQ